MTDGIKTEAEYMDMRKQEIVEGSRVLCHLKDPALDRVMGGVRSRKTTLLAGVSSSGKTTIMTQMAVDVAGQGVPALIVEREMAPYELVQKSLAYLGGGTVTYGDVARHILDTGECDDEVAKAVRDCDRAYTEGPGRYIVCTRRVRDMGRIEELVVAMEARFGIAPIIFIDFIQEILPREECRVSDYYENLRYTLEGMRELAYSHRTQVVGITKINKRPSKLEDFTLDVLNGGASVGYAADAVVALYSKPADETKPLRPLVLTNLKARTDRRETVTGVLDQERCRFIGEADQADGL